MYAKKLSASGPAGSFQGNDEGSSGLLKEANLLSQLFSAVASNSAAVVSRCLVCLKKIVLVKAGLRSRQRVSLPDEPCE